MKRISDVVSGDRYLPMQPPAPDLLGVCFDRIPSLLPDLTGSGLIDLENNIKSACRRNPVGNPPRTVS
ncbi:MAG: hypothetical protein F6J93_22895 [Oscillatoria sp. SIO1A7]|nr:hypothetical protein [Oscillatoria sp. SIO1A7]